MNRCFYVFLCSLVFVFGLTSVSYAQGGGLVVSPKRVVFKEGQRIVEVLLANRGDQEERFRISIVNRAMQENGQLIEVETPAQDEFFAKGHIKYSPRQVTLKPKETQKIRLMSRLAADAPEGEYRSHILIQEIPKAKKAESASGDENDGDLGVSVTAIFGISLPVILRKGDLDADVSLSTPKIRKAGEDTFLDIAINRSGTKSIIGTANVFAESQKIGILKNVAVYLSSPKRIVSIKLDPERAKSLSGKNIRVTFGSEEEYEDAPPAEFSFTAP
ncbi:MAG: fimbrial biogenesis chaperone [Alphaproteobacteria bacterium]